MSAMESPDLPSARERVEGRIARLLRLLPGRWLLRLIGEQPLSLHGHVLDAHVQFILASRRRKPQHQLCEPTVVAGRQRYRREIQAVSESAGVRPTRIQSVQNLMIDGADGPLAARHYAPPASSTLPPKPMLVFLHGGGFVLGDLDTHDEPCRLLCHHGDMHVLSVAYRLAPEHPFPAPIDDACASVRWAQAHAADFGADPARVCVGGDSAGGNLSVVASLTLAHENRAPAAQLLIYPATDFEATTPSRNLFASGFILTVGDMDIFESHYLGDRALALRRDPRSSPVRSTALATSPPTLVTTAEFDPLRDEGETFADALRAAGVDVRLVRMRGLPHGYLHMTTIVPAAESAMIETAKAFRGLLDDRASRRSNPD